MLTRTKQAGATTAGAAATGAAAAATGAATAGAAAAAAAGAAAAGAATAAGATTTTTTIISWQGRSEFYPVRGHTADRASSPTPWEDHKSSQHIDISLSQPSRPITLRHHIPWSPDGGGA